VGNPLGPVASGNNMVLALDRFFVHRVLQGNNVIAEIETRFL
jgi:hypothetical protein